MDREFLGITSRRATKDFRQLYDAYPDDREAKAALAEELETTPRIIGNQKKRCLDGKDITGELFPIICSRRDRAQAFGLEISDPRLSQPTSGLLAEYREEVRRDFEGNLRQRELALAEREDELDRKEVALAEETERFRADVKEREEALEEGRRDLNRRNHRLAEKERQAEAREAKAQKIMAEVEEREERMTKWAVIAEEFKPGGLLESQPGKSVALLQAEFEERYQNEHFDSRRQRHITHGDRLIIENRKRAGSRRIAIEEEERTFNIMVRPLRAIIHKIATSA